MAFGYKTKTKHFGRVSNVYYVKNISTGKVFMRTTDKAKAQNYALSRNFKGANLHIQERRVLERQ
jgi:hypothetical protein